MELKTKNSNYLRYFILPNCERDMVIRLISTAGMVNIHCQNLNYKKD